MRSKITIIADSLARCRPLENQPWEVVYPGLLALDERLIVLDKSKVSADTSVFLERENLYYDIRYSDSEYFILHLGICDVSPRLFTKKQKILIKLLEDSRLIKNIINRWIAYRSKRRLHITTTKKIQNVNQNEFKENIKTIIDEIIESNKNLKKIFVVNIINPGEYLVKKNYGITAEVMKYNQEILEICCKQSDTCLLIDLFRYTYENPDAVLDDGHHLSKKGHEFLYKNIISNLI